MSRITFTIYRSDEYRQAYAVEHASSCPDTIDVVVYVSDLPREVRKLLCSAGKYPACVRWIYLSDGKCCASASHLRCEHKSKLCFDCDESVTPAEIGRLVVDTFETLKQAEEESKQAKEAAAKQAEEAAKQAELERARELMEREFDILSDCVLKLRDELDSLYRLLDCINRDTVHETLSSVAQSIGS